MIINRTPHPITITTHGASEPALTLPAAPRGHIARVETTTEHPYTLVVGGTEAPSARQRWGQITGLPAPERGVAHVVSAVVAAAALCSARGADDLLVPGEQVRDDEGRIVGARCLISARDAMPHLASGAQVWCCYSADDARAWGVPEWALRAAMARPGPVSVEVRGEWTLTSMAPGEWGVAHAPLVDAADLAAWAIVCRVWETHFDKVWVRHPKDGPYRVDLVEYVEALMLRPHLRTISSVAAPPSATPS